MLLLPKPKNCASGVPGVAGKTAAAADGLGKNTSGATPAGRDVVPRRHEHTAVAGGRTVDPVVVHGAGHLTGTEEVTGSRAHGLAAQHEAAAPRDRLGQNAVAVIAVRGDGAARLRGDVDQAAGTGGTVRAAEFQIDAVVGLLRARRAAGPFQICRQRFDDTAAAGDGLRNDADGVVRGRLDRTGARDIDLTRFAALSQAALHAIGADRQLQLAESTIAGAELLPLFLLLLDTDEVETPPIPPPPAMD